MIAVVGGGRLRLPQVEEAPSAAAMQWDRFKLKIPMKIGDIVQKVALARFSRTFSALIAAGVPMLEAIEITGRTSGNRSIEKAMDGRPRLGQEGRHASPRRCAERPRPSRSMVTQMIGVGEETGALDDDAHARSPTSTRTRSRRPSRR